VACQPDVEPDASEQLIRLEKSISEGAVCGPFFWRRPATQSGRGAAVAATIVMALMLGACSSLRAINWLVPGDSYELDADIEYGPDPRQKLDVYRPRLAATAQVDANGFPLVVFFHGGNWTTGERADYKFIGEALASRGILTVVASFRKYPAVRYPDFLADCALATAWAVREASRYGGDSRRLVLMGHSSGAYNAAMLALDHRWLSSAGLAPSSVTGWVGLAGPYDFFPMRDPKTQPVFHHPDYPPGALPVDHVSTSSPQTFLAAAAKDDLVDPVRNSRQLADKLRAAGVPVTLRVYDGVNHYTLIGAFGRPLRGLAPVLEDVATFVHAAPAPR